MADEQQYPKCRRCGRKLTNPKYRDIGFGPSCYKKYLKEHHRSSYNFLKKEEPCD